MSVHRDKRGYWFSAWRDEDGKRKNKYFGKDGEAEAHKWDQEHYAKPDPLTIPTLIELAAFYFENKPTLHPNTQKTIISYLDKYCSGFRDKPVELLSKRDVTTLRRRMAKKSPTSQNRALAYIRAIINFGLEHDLCHFNPLAGVKMLKEIKKPFTATLEDMKKVLDQAPDHVRWAAAVQYSLCLRPGEKELLRLRWEAFRWGEGAVYCSQGKGCAPKMVYPPESFLFEAWDRFQEDQKKGMNYVIHYAGRAPLTSLKTAWNSAKKRAGLAGKRLRMYDLRHLAATEMLARGADPAAVQSQLGHSQLSTTLNNYGHVLAGAQKRASGLMPALESPSHNPVMKNVMKVMKKDLGEIT